MGASVFHPKKGAGVFISKHYICISHWVGFDVNNIFNTYFDTDWCLPSTGNTWSSVKSSVAWICYLAPGVLAQASTDGLEILRGAIWSFPPPKSNMTMENPPFEDVLMSC